MGMDGKWSFQLKESSISSIEGKLNRGFGEEMFNISHFHMSLWIQKQIPNMQLK
jgi:hypothetical protein